MMCTIPGGDERDHGPHDAGRGTAVACWRSTASSAEMSLEVRLELGGEPLRLGLLPRERRRGVEQLDAPTVVIARAAHELIEDVERRRRRR